MEYFGLKDFIKTKEGFKDKTIYIYIPRNDVFLDRWSNRYYEKGDEIGNDCVKYYYVSCGIANRIEPAPTLIAPKSAFYDFSYMYRLNLEQYTSVNIPLAPGRLGQYYYERCFSVLELGNNSVICAAFDNSSDMVKHIMSQYCEYSIIEDMFSGEKQISWKQSLDNVIPFAYSIGGNNITNAIPLLIKGSIPFVTLNNSKEQFVFQFRKKGFSTHRFVKGDTFHFIFQNNKHLQFELKASASNAHYEDYKMVSFSLLPQDVKLFSEELLVAIRCEFRNGDAPFDLEPKNEIAFQIVRVYFQKYIKALSECGIDLESSKTNKEEHKTSNVCDMGISLRKHSGCFVYLMKDLSNGYYKIGISNKPEYRERTLQSEKPTIILICAKEYPSRIIAEAIESSLHKAFGEKRLRGEWFELSKDDVDDIEATLL